jgi:hypothetical protein
MSRFRSLSVLLPLVAIVICRVQHADAQTGGSYCGPQFGEIVRNMDEDDVKDVTKVDCSFTSFGGTIPSQVGRLTELTILRCAYCGLQGTLPPELNQLSKLQNL